MEETTPITGDVEELVDNDPLPEPYVPGEQGDDRQMLLTPEKRREILGKLAEFEAQLSAFTYLQQNFVLAVLRDPTNIKSACRQAGYGGNENTLKVKASQLMNDPRIAQCIAIGQQLREDRTMVTSERTINELAIIAFSNIADYTVLPGSNEVTTRDGVPEYALRAVSSAEYTTTVTEGGDRVTTTYKVKIKLWSKTDALRMLAMYQKLLAGDSNITVNDNRGQVHNHQHNTWQFGDRKITF